MDKKHLIARLTITRASGRKTIVEVHEGASYHSFYNVFTQDGNRWSTKTLVRKANRNEGLPVINTHLHKPGLEAIARRIALFKSQTNPIVSSQVRIIKKRAYQKLLHANPEALGMIKSRSSLPPSRWRSAGAIPVQLPARETVRR